MRKFLIKILLFFLMVSLIDVTSGIVFQYMNDNSKGGGIKSRYYVCKESYEDILIFGSSRAKHHYVPDVIEDSLGFPCYNTGEDGNGIILCYGFLKMITQRYSPKMIIYYVSQFDLYEDDNVKYLNLLKPYYYEVGIDSMFWSINPRSRLMMLSNLYRYNTTWLPVLGNFVHPMKNYPKGYSALNNTMEYEPDSLSFLQTEARVIDSLKIKYFEKFIIMAKDNNIRLICCISPSYKVSSKMYDYKPIRQLCAKYNIPFVGNEGYYEINHDKSLFQDRTHMNDIGARQYTSILMKWIKDKCLL